jgi:hypothetical protein
MERKTMSPEQQRIAIAEACGWTAKQDSNGWWRAVHKLTGNAIELWLSERSVWSVGIPDYLNDLNAMHEAEKVLIDKGVNAWWEYVAFINRHNPTPFRSETAVNATAAQKSKAFLHTLNLWQPTPTQPQ